MFLAAAREQECWDQAFAEFTGLSTDFLMEQAALSMALYLRQNELFGHNIKTIRLFCGVGHNGGDGYALARILAAWKEDVRIYEFSPERPRQGIVAQNREACLRMGLHVLPIERYDVTEGLHIDAIYGIGYRQREKENPALRLFQDKMSLARERYPSSFRLVAVDIPSGLEADSACHGGFLPLYDEVFCMGQAKFCSVAEQLKERVRKWTVLPLSIPSQVYRKYPPQVWRSIFDETALKTLWPDRPSAAHKGHFGQVGIVAGSQGMSGAGLLAMEAALISGAGRVYAAVPQEAFSAALQRCPAALTQSRPDFADASQAVSFIERFLALLGRPEQAVCLFGPGLSNEKQIGPMLECLLDWPGQLVLDASALTWIAREPLNMATFVKCCKRRFEEGWSAPVLTPHVGEYRLLSRAWKKYEIQQERQMTAFTMNRAVTHADEDVVSVEDTGVFDVEEDSALDEMMEACLTMAAGLHCAIYRKSAFSFLAWQSLKVKKGGLESLLQNELRQGQQEGSDNLASFITWIKTGTAALARAGSGDILAGLAAGLTARFGSRVPLQERGQLGLLCAAYLCGRTAELFTASHGQAYFGVDDEFSYLQILLQALLEKEIDHAKR